MELYQIYHPITATPFACDDDYMEFAPCDALKPYIRCFWGTRRPIRKIKTGIPTHGIVTPDTCMDIIFTVDFTNNKVHSSFCGIDDRTFHTCNNNNEEKIAFTFAIRFYAWSAALFSEESMRDTRNAFFDVGYHFSKIKTELEPLLFDIVEMEKLIAAAETILLKNYHAQRENTRVLEAVYKILMDKGNIRTDQLSREIHISSRQLERLFREYIGISPKNLASMVRYQYLWNDILYEPQFNVLDAVHKYGYTDQAHLLHEFKKFHSVNVTDARKYAYKNVAFLQA